ncbi:MAG TPA: siderophore-interacting protein [Polyangiales bacterium]|nr:siderophore-interacting protein [Polyangiales bacterium]
MGRTLTVLEVESLTPRMRRITLGSPSLAGFVSLSPDDHVKLFFPSEHGEPTMRDFTPRAFDTERCTLRLDFALHDTGPATRWAAGARVGDTLEIGGPRGSRVVADDFDWYLLIGDESALAALGRWVETLRPGVPAITVVCIADAREKQVFATRACWSPTWIERGEPSARDVEHVLAALAAFQSPPGDGFVWCAGEAAIARAVRALFVQERAHPRAWTRTSSYWKRGANGAHEELEE